eukprot:COSAG01_NODE_397_length_17560_cov_111.258347_19_plen_57_part_00
MRMIVRPGPQLLNTGGDVVRKRDTETAAVLAQPALPARRDVPPSRVRVESTSQTGL